jgi:hypothetical protein
MLRFLGSEYGYFDEALGANQSGYFQPYMTSLLGQFNFHDGGDGVDQMSSQYWMANRMGDPDLSGYRYNMMRDNKSGAGVFDVLWYDPDNCNKNVDLPKDRLYSAHMETATMRASWTDSAGVFVGLHGGANDVNHGHTDMGTFILDALGVRWALDLGADSYALPNYMSNPNVYRRRAEGHNTVVIDPPGTQQGQWAQGMPLYYDQDYRATGVVERFVTKPLGAFAVLDMTASRADRLNAGRRGVQLTPGREQVIVQDEFDLKSAGDAYWFMHTKAEIAVAEDGRSVDLTQNGKHMNLTLVSNDAALKFEVTKAQTMEWETEQYPSLVIPGQNTNLGVQRLVVHSKNKKDFKMMVVFTPQAIPGLPVVLPEYKPLDEWDIPDGELASDFSSELTAIQLDGENFESFYNLQSTYSVRLAPDALEPPEVTATYTGDAEMQVYQADSTHGSAVIALKDAGNGRTRYYSVQFTPDTLLGEMKDKIERKVKSFEASEVPQPENPPAHSLDADFATRFAVEGEGQWIVYDLGEAAELSAVSVAWYRGGAERSTDYAIDLSTDGKTWTEKFRGISRPDTDDFNTTVFAPESARYVRIRGYGNTVNKWNSITEVRFWE